MEGQVFRDGRMENVTALSVADLHDSSGAPYTGTINLQGDAGDIEIQYEIVDKRYVNFNLLHPVGLRPGIDLNRTECMFATECPVKFTWDGEVGYGWLERVRPHKFAMQ